MRILFDQGTPVPLRNHLNDHQVSTAHELGWASFQNGELLEQAENQGFEVFVTTDQNLKYQQNQARRKIAIVVLSAASWPRIQTVLPDIVDAVNSARPDSYSMVNVPFGR